MPEEHTPTDCAGTPDTELEQLRLLVGEQVSLIEQLRERIQELEARLVE